MSRKRDRFFLSVPGDDRLGLTVNLPAALRGGGVHALPPHAPVAGSLVDRFPACPADWPRSSGSTASYFVPIVEGRGLWLDFNRCADHKHHVAIVVSIQGVNPLTGRKADKLELEAYPDDDSVEKWLRGRQNYLATTSTPDGLLWIDGFRAKDGTVRQYIFTREERKGVAAQLIGVDRVFAIGAAFFLSKEPRPPRPVSAPTYGSMVTADGAGWVGVIGPALTDWKIGASLGDTPTTSKLNLIENAGINTAYCSSDAKVAMSLTSSLGPTGPAGAKGDLGEPGLGVLRSMSLKGVPMAYNMCSSVAPPVLPSLSPDKSLSLEADADAAVLEIAAGAEIDQMLYRDSVGLDFWQPKCAGRVVVSYAPAEIIRRILSAGEVEEPEGFLEGLEVGNK